MSEEPATTPADGEADTGLDPSNEVAADDTTSETDTETTDQEVEGDEPETTPEDGDDDGLEEVEFDGVKARIPTAFKRGLLREADYTQKAQVVADRAKQLDTRETELNQRSEQVEATIQERVELLAVQRQLKALDEMSEDDWDKLEDEDPKEARRLNRLRERLRGKAAELNDTLQTKESEALEAKRAESATRLKDGLEVLARDIKGWSPELARQLTDFGKANGLTQADFTLAMSTPAIGKLLHKAFVGDQALKREAAAKKVRDAQDTKPERQVGGASPNARKTTDASGDGLSTAEWIRRERERVRSKRRA